MTDTQELLIQMADLQVLREQFKTQQLPRRNLYNLIQSTYNRMSNEMTINRYEYEEYEKKLSNISTSNNEKLLQNINLYTGYLQELKSMLNVTNRELDSISLKYEYVCLFSSLLSLVKNVDTIFNNEISNNLTNQAYDTHPVFGIISQFAWYCIFWSQNLRFLSTVGHVWGSRRILRKLFKTTKVCEESLIEIQDCFTQDVEDEEVKNVFFSQWDKDIVDVVENSLPNLSTKEKTFTFLYLSVLNIVPNMLTKLDFLKKMFIFSTSKFGRQWYERNVIQHLFPKMETIAGNNDFIDMTELSHSTTFMDAAILPKIEINRFESGMKITNRLQVYTKYASPFVYGAMDCFFVYFSCRELLHGVKNKNSTLLQDMASSAEKRLEQMNLFTKKYYRVKNF